MYEFSHFLDDRRENNTQVTNCSDSPIAVYPPWSVDDYIPTYHTTGNTTVGTHMIFKIFNSLSKHTCDLRTSFSLFVSMIDNLLLECSHRSKDYSPLSRACGTFNIMTSGYFQDSQWTIHILKYHVLNIEMHQFQVTMTPQK